MTSRLPAKAFVPLAVAALTVPLVACGDEQSADPSEVVERYAERRDAGADCAELFEIRNELDPDDDLVEAINEGLRKIGCFNATSSRTDLEEGPSSTALDGVSLCEDATGDGTAGDLVAVQLSASGEFLNIAWDTTEPLDGTEIGYYVNIFGAGKQIGLRSIDGEIFRFVADLNGEGQENLTSSYTVEGTTATLVVPTSALDGLEQPFDYTATITAGGQDLDDCADTFPN